SPRHTVGAGPGSTAGSALPRRRRTSFRNRLGKDRQMAAVAIPAALALLVLCYIPILGDVVHFQDYYPYCSVWEAPFVGLEKFIELFDDERFLLSLRNTLVYATFQLVLFFPLPILLALIVDSLVSPRLRKAFQSIVYLPHFLSWVLVIALFQQMLGGAGFINQFLVSRGLDPIPFMTNSDTFALLIVGEIAWKDAGWGMIIFLAALASI